MNKTLGAALAVVVLSLAAFNVVLFQRVRSLEEKLAAAEKRAPAGTAPADEGSSRPLPADTRRKGGTTGQGTHAEPMPTGERTSGGSEERPKNSNTASTLTPEMKEAIAREVEAVIKEKYGHFPGFMDMTDPMALLEKELNLNPSQKIRVGDLWKKREAAVMKAHEEGGNFSEMFKKMKAVEEEYDVAIKKELDVDQQKKYDELRKSGRLHGGIMIKIGGDSKEDK